MGKSRDLFKKIRDTKGTFHAKMGSIKDRNGMDLTEAHNKGTPKSIKQLLMSHQNGEIYSNTLTVGDFTNSLYQ